MADATTWDRLERIVRRPMRREAVKHPCHLEIVCSRAPKPQHPSAPRKLSAGRLRRSRSGAGKRTVDNHCFRSRQAKRLQHVSAPHAVTEARTCGWTLRKQQVRSRQSLATANL